MEKMTIEMKIRRRLIKDIIDLINDDICCDYDEAIKIFPITFSIVNKLGSSEIRFLGNKIAILKGE